VTLDSGTAQGGGATSITLAASASDQDEFYVPGLVVTLAGTGALQARRISAYNGTTRVATVATAWVTNPDNDTDYQIIPWASVRVSDIDDNAITAASIASDAITDAKVAADVTIASVTGAVGSVTAGVTLADDAITAAKFDESTAFPLKADDSGATQVARSGADSDTLETLSDEIAIVDGIVDQLVARLVALSVTTGSVQTNGGNSATAFETNLAETEDDHWADAYLLLTSGDLSGQVKRVSAYNGTSKVITVVGGFTDTPADSVTFALINR
jgi:hypothetical protein